jgi:hypothetical protein
METNQAISVLARNIDKKKEELEKKVFKISNGKLIPTLKRLQVRFLAHSENPSQKYPGKIKN